MLTMDKAKQVLYEELRFGLLIATGQLERLAAAGLTEKQTAAAVGIPYDQYEMLLAQYPEAKTKNSQALALRHLAALQDMRDSEEAKRRDDWFRRTVRDPEFRDIDRISDFPVEDDNRETKADWLVELFKEYDLVPKVKKHAVDGPDSAEQADPS